MNTFKVIIKSIFKHFYNTYALAEKIKNIEEFERQKRWLNRVKRLYKCATIIAVLATFFSAIFIAKMFEINSIIVMFAMPLLVLTCWGYVSMALYFKPMIKSIWNATKFGYKTGEKIKETHVNVSHEFGDTYKVSSYETDKGVLFAYIMSVVSFVCWVAFCIYVAPFLTYKKAKNTIKNLEQFENMSKDCEQESVNN